MGLELNNAVLFYVQYASGRSVRVNLLKVLDTTFTEEEMGNAKDILWGLVGEEKRSKRYLHVWILLMHIVNRLFRNSDAQFSCGY